MARKKKSRKISDIMPIRKSDKKPEAPKLSGKKLTRYELDAKAREDKKKRKHKGLASGSRHSNAEQNKHNQVVEQKDPRIGSRKKVPLIVEFVNKPEKGMTIPAVKEPKKLAPEVELERLENSKANQQFVDKCLDRIAQLMEELGIQDEDETEDDLYRTFEKIDINQFR